MHAVTSGFLRLKRVPVVKAITIMLTLAVLLMSGRGALAETPGAGIASDNEYDGVQLLWVVRWEQPWTVDEQATASEPGQYDRLVLHDGDATMRMILDFDQDPGAALSTMIQVTDISEGGATILGEDNGTDGYGWPYVSATLSYPGFEPTANGEPWIEYIEAGPAFTYDANFGIHLTSVIAPESQFADAFAAAQTHLKSNLGDQGPFFVGNPVGAPGMDDGGNTGKATGDSVSADDYVAQLSSELTTLADSIDAFQNLLQSPTLGDEASINQLEAILTTWTTAYDTARTIVPPSGYEKVHALYLDFTSLLSGAASDLYQGDADAATKKLERALVKLKKLQSTLEQGSGDLMDRKSG